MPSVVYDTVRSLREAGTCDQHFVFDRVSLLEKYQHYLPQHGKPKHFSRRREGSGLEPHSESAGLALSLQLRRTCTVQLNKTTGCSAKSVSVC